MHGKAGSAWEFCNVLILYSIDPLFRMKEPCEEMTTKHVLGCSDLLKYFHESSKYSYFHFSRQQTNKSVQNM